MFAHSDYYSSQLGDIWDSLEKSLFATKLSMFKSVFRFDSADSLKDCGMILLKHFEMKQK